MENQDKRFGMISGCRYKLFALYILLIPAFLFMQCGTSRDSDFQEERTWQPGDIYEDENGWLEARAGDMPIVISAPHGGLMEPEEIPDRSCSGITTVRDRNVTEMAFEMEEELLTEYGKRPFVIAAHIRRTKIDLNRNIKQATCGNPVMEETWEQYHNYIEGAIAKAVEKFGFAVFVDLHGHAHDKQRLELGYDIRKQDVRDAYLDAEAAAVLSSESTLRNLMNINNELDFQELLTGEYAFGTLMENEGIAAVPSMEDPYPLKDDPYLTTGYNIRHYNSEEYPNVFGWMIEANWTGVRENQEGQHAFATAFTKSIMAYIEEHIEYTPE